MSPLDELIAIEAIRRLKAEYFRCTDQQDWETLVGLFTPDAVTDMRDAVEPHNPKLIQHDPRAFAATNSAFLAGVKTAHFGYMPQIDILSDDSASGTWGMEDWLWVPEGHKVLPRGRVHGWGTYHDRYARVDGRWLFSATRLTRIHIEFVAATD